MYSRVFFQEEQRKKQKKLTQSHPAIEEQWRKKEERAKRKRELQRKEEKNNNEPHRRTGNKKKAIVDEEIKDSLNAIGVEGVLNSRKDRNEVRELEQWKKVMRKKLTGETYQMDEQYELKVFMKNLTINDQQENDALLQSFKELNLRQSVLPKDKFVQIGAVEKKKNQLFLGIYEKQSKQQDSKLMTRNHEINKILNQIMEINKAVDRLNEKIKKGQETQHYLEKKLKRRLKLLSEKKMIEKLKKLAIAHSASLANLALANEKQPNLSFQRVVSQNDSNSDSMATYGGMDIFEFDDEYKETKSLLEEKRYEVEEYQMRVKDREKKISRLKRNKEKLEKNITIIKRDQKGIQKAQMDFLMHSIKKGKDARSEGIVWMMSTIKRLGGEIREDFLPEFLDEQSKHFLMNKLRVYEKLIENQALYKFYWDVFKGYVGRDENNLTFQNFEILKRQRNAHLTVDDTYIVEPELRIEGSVYDENTLLHVRPDSSIVNYSLKDSLKIVMNRVRNLNSAARPDKSDKKIKFDINEYKQASKSNLDTDREENQQDTSNKLDVIGSIKRSLSARSLSINFDEKFVSASKRVIELKKELGENGDVNWGQLPVGERQKLYSVKKVSELEEKSENEKEYRELNDRSQSDSDILSINENDLNGSRESDKPNPRHYSPPPSQKGMMIKIKEVPEKSSEFDLNIETKDRNYRVENLSMEVEDSQGIEENSIQNQGTPEFQNHLDNECVSGTQSPIFPKNDEISDDKETPLRYDEDNMDSPSLPYIGKNHAADSKKQFTIRSSIKSSENEHRIIRQLKLQRINLTSAATYKSSIPSIFSTGATYICDQNYKLPFEAAISAPKLNYAEVCFRRVCSNVINPGQKPSQEVTETGVQKFKK